MENMESIKLEKKVKVSPNPISIPGINNIIFQMQNTVCKIYKEDGINGSGFFCKIPYPGQNKFLPALITNNHILNSQDIEINKKIF